MKKLFTVLAVLLVATALFAGVTVKAGGTFGFANMSNATKEGSEFEDEAKMSSHGFGFGVGVQYDLSDKLAVYGEFNMVFPKDAEIKYEAATVKVSDMVKEEYGDFGKYTINFFSVSAGVAYKLDLNAVKLVVGGGITFNRAGFAIHVEETTAGVTYKLDIKYAYANIGLNALVDAKYMVAEKVGVGVTLNPQLGLYNIAKLEAKTVPETPYNYDDKATGFKVSFAMPITVGVSYTF